MQTLTDHKEIKAWLDSMGIVGYTINPDDTVSVDGTVKLMCKNLDYIPVKFAKVGSFLVYCNNLTTLENCPADIQHSLDISDNALTTLKGCPTTIGDHFDCANNKLTTLEHGPRHVLGGYYAQNNKINTLQFFPMMAGGNVNLTNNALSKKTVSCFLKYVAGLDGVNRAHTILGKFNY